MQLLSKCTSYQRHGEHLLPAAFQATAHAMQCSMISSSRAQHLVSPSPSSQEALKQTTEHAETTHVSAQ
jgi:hypothetical protein